MNTCSAEVFHTPIKSKDRLFEYLYGELVIFDFNIIRTQNQSAFESVFMNYLTLLGQFQIAYPDDIQLLFSRTEQFFMYVRDSVKGKGQKLQFYIMIYHYHCFFKERCHTFITTRFDEHYFGSFCDFKYLSEFVYNKTLDKNHALIDLLVNIHTSLLFKGMYPNFICKWIPREKTKFKWLFQKYAVQFCKNACYTYRNKNDAAKFLRTFVSNHSYTCEKFLCTRNYSCIDATEKNMCKYYRVLVDKQHELSWFYESKHVLKYPYVKHNAVNPGALMKTMFNILNKRLNNDHDSGLIYGIDDDSKLIQLLNKKWDQSISFYKKIFKPKDLVIFIELSYESFNLNMDSFYNIIGMSCFLSHFSNKAYKRMFLASNTPIWINIQECNSLFDIATHFQSILKYDCMTSSELPLCVQLLLQSFKSAENDINDNHTLVFMQGSHIEHTVDYITTNTRLDTYKKVFWNFCDFTYFNKGIYNNLYNKNVQFVSGNNENVLHPLWNDINMFENLIHKIKLLDYSTTQN